MLFLAFQFSHFLSDSRPDDETGENTQTREGFDIDDGNVNIFLSVYGFSFIYFVCHRSFF